MNTDVLHKITNLLDHNRYTVIAFITFAVLFGDVISMTGCQSTTAGLIPGKDGHVTEVTRSEFTRQAAIAEKDLAVKKVELDADIIAYNKETEAFNAQVQAGIDDLERKDAVKREIIDTVGLVATQAAQEGINPISLIPLGIGLLGTALGLGASADNRRKDQVIAGLKHNTPAPAGT